MTSPSGLQEYLARFGRRFKVDLASRGLGFVALVALLLTVVLVFVANRFAFSDASVISTRTLLFAGLAAAIAALVVLPVLRHRRKGIGREAEESVPAFRGRVETYLDHLRKVEESGQSKNPFLDLLAEDAMEIAETAPVEDVVTTGRIVSYTAVAVLCLGTLFWLATAGPGYWGYGASRLWGGWVAVQDKPIYDVIVDPGDATIRSGATLVIKAQLIGFESNDVRIYAQYESGVEWEVAPMSPQLSEPGFEVMFTGVHEPFRYYVETGGVRTDTYQVNVVVLPNIETVKLSYRYPSWTGLEEFVEDPGGDIRAVVGTVVVVEATTDKPLAGGVLTVGDEDIPLRADGLILRGEITVEEDGEYHFATSYDGEHVRLTDDFFITTVENQKPEVKVTKPGRDWKATSIEEVPAAFEVSDDFGVRSFDLSYSVNGSEFTTVKLAGAGRKSATAPHTFYLEDLRVSPSPFDQASGITELPEPGNTDGKRSLRPGDLISYYVSAKDNRNTSQTDIYFIEIQPFDRQFSQSQQRGGGGGGQQQQRDETSRRQKEIISATWNLIRESESADSRSRQEIRESTVMLSELQRTLREQALTMAERTRARQLDGTNSKFREFVENLEKAAAAMEPAAEELSDQDLQAAVQPEQQALQYLLRAESIFTAIQISMQQGGGGGGGGGAGRDLAEMFELEMDLEKNQYETGGGASQQQLEREVDDAFKKLEELAKRQEQLAEKMRNQQETTFAERWQQEMLRREAEELKRQMEQLQRRQQSQQSSSQQQQAQSGQQQQGSQGGQGGQSGSQQQQQQQLQETIRRLEQATQAMQQGAQQNSGQRQSGAQARQGAQRAQQQLQEALKELTEQRQQANQSALADLSNRADRLVEQQAEVQPHLEEALRQALEVMRQQQAEGRRTRLPSGLTPAQEQEFSELKSQMAEALRSIEADMQGASRRMRETQPGASQKLREALSELQQEDVGTRLETAAEYIRRQAAPYVANSEEGVARALRQLSERLREAQRQAQQGGGTPGQERLGNALAEMERLRRRLEQAAQPAGPRRGAEHQGKSDLAMPSPRWRGYVVVSSKPQASTSRAEKGRSKANRVGSSQANNLRTANSPVNNRGKGNKGRDKDKVRARGNSKANSWPKAAAEPVAVGVVHASAVRGTAV